MNVERTPIAGVLVIEPRVFRDARGAFLESWNARVFAAAGIEAEFVQDNQSTSTKGVLRGLHYQVQKPQGKLLRVTAGEIWDVGVDLRRGSPSFGRHFAVKLDALSHRIVWFPPGFAHGFLVLSEHAEVQYKVTDYYAPELERTLLWNDPALAIGWPLEGAPLLSDKDREGTPLSRAEACG